MGEQIVEVMTTSGDFATEKSGSRIFIYSISISGSVTNVNIRRGGAGGDIIWTYAGTGHFPFYKPLEGLAPDTDDGDIYVEISGTGNVSIVGSRGR